MGLNPNKAQILLKNMDMKYRISDELVNTFMIKRQDVANEHTNKDKKSMHQ